MREFQQAGGAPESQVLTGQNPEDKAGGLDFQGAGLQLQTAGWYAPSGAYFCAGIMSSMD